MTCKVCGREMKLNAQGMCSSCYGKALRERKKNGTYTDRRFGTAKNGQKEISRTTQEIVNRIKAGEKQSDIASKFGVSKQYVSQCKRRYLDCVQIFQWKF